MSRVVFGGEGALHASVSTTPTSPCVVRSGTSDTMILPVRVTVSACVSGASLSAMHWYVSLE